MKTIQTYHRAKTLAEAYELNQKKTSTILGGMMWLNMSGGRIGTSIKVEPQALAKVARAKFDDIIRKAE